MKKLLPLILAGVCIFAGCASTNEFRSDSTPRPPTTSVEVFKAGTKPTRATKTIAELSFLGPREDELRAQKFFIKRAQTLGGNALLFRIEGGETKAGGMGAAWGISTTYVFKGEVLVFE